MPLKLAVKQAVDVANEMAYIHGLGFIHRDLKSDILLIAADKSIKIADFRVARIEVHSEGMTPQTGTNHWMAPEMIQNRPYKQKVEVYSFWDCTLGAYHRVASFPRNDSTAGSCLCGSNRCEASRIVSIF
ncbi:hypothetical protein CRYUN_Cryun11dG0054900 [Craigia yunnanensis]